MKWIPPDDFQGNALHFTLLFFANHHRPLLAIPFGIANRGRSLSLGFHFVHSRHEEDFCESEAINRVLRDLEHKRLVSIHARGIADCLPVRDRPKCPTPRGCDQVLCHFDCPLTVHASIRAAPEEVLTPMSLLKSGLLWTRFGDQLAFTY